MDPTSLVGPCVGPSSFTYSYTAPFTPLPPKDRHRIDIDPSMFWAGPVGAVRDGTLQGAPAATPDLTHVPAELNTTLFLPSLPTTTQPTSLLSPLPSSPSLSRISFENPDNYSPSFQEFPRSRFLPFSHSVTSILYIANTPPFPNVGTHPLPPRE